MQYTQANLFYKNLFQTIAEIKEVITFLRNGERMDAELSLE